METVFTAGWMISLPLCILAGLVLWVCILNDDTKWQVEVSGNDDPAQWCKDQIEIETEDYGRIILTCQRWRHSEESKHRATTITTDYIDDWEWSWPTP